MTALRALALLGVAAFGSAELDRKEMQGMKDGFEWYCFECKSRVHRIEVPLGTIVADLPSL